MAEENSSAELNIKYCGVDEFPGLQGKRVCLSGVFARQSKSAVGERIKRHGGIVVDYVSSNTDVLLVGQYSNAAWKYGNYGTKIENAVRLQEQGSSILILKEQDFYSILEKIDGGLPKNEEKSEWNPGGSSESECREQIAYWNKRRTSLRNAIFRLEGTAQAKKSALSALEQMICETEEKRDQCRLNAEKQERERAELQEKIDRLESEIAGLKKQSENYKQERDRSAAEAAAVEETLKAQQEMAASARQKWNGMELALQNMRRQVERIENSITQENVRLAEIQKENETKNEKAAVAQQPEKAPEVPAKTVTAFLTSRKIPYTKFAGYIYVFKANIEDDLLNELRNAEYVEKIEEVGRYGRRCWKIAERSAPPCTDQKPQTSSLSKEENEQKAQSQAISPVPVEEKVVFQKKPELRQDHLMSEFQFSKWLRMEKNLTINFSNSVLRKIKVSQEMAKRLVSGECKMYSINRAKLASWMSELMSKSEFIEKDKEEQGLFTRSLELLAEYAGFVLVKETKSAAEPETEEKEEEPATVSEPAEAPEKGPAEETDPLVAKLNALHADYVDQRAQGGALWVMSPGAVYALSKDGHKFIYAPNGTNSTDQAPAWYLKKENEPAVKQNAFSDNEARVSLEIEDAHEPDGQAETAEEPQTADVDSADTADAEVSELPEIEPASLEDRSYLEDAVCEALKRENAGATPTFISMLVKADIGEVTAILDQADWAERRNRIYYYKAEADAMQEYHFRTPLSLAYTVPVEIRYFGENRASGTNRWREAYIRLVQCLVEDYEDVFRKLAIGDIDSIVSDDFATAQGAVILNGAYPILPDLYAEVDLSAGKLMTAVKELLRLCNVDEENVVITYRRKIPARDWKKIEASVPKTETQIEQEPVPALKEEAKPAEQPAPAKMSVSITSSSLTKENFAVWMRTEKKLPDLERIAVMRRLDRIQFYMIKRISPTCTLFTENREIAEFSYGTLMADPQFETENVKNKGTLKEALEYYSEFAGITELHEEPPKQEEPEPVREKEEPVLAEESEKEASKNTRPAHFQGEKFQKWLHDKHGMNYKQQQQIVAALSACQILVKRSDLQQGNIIFTMDRAQLSAILLQLLQSKQYIQKNRQNGGAYREALEYLAEYVGVVIGEKYMDAEEAAQTSDAPSALEASETAEATQEDSAAAGSETAENNSTAASASDTATPDEEDEKTVKADFANWLVEAKAMRYSEVLRLYMPYLSQADAYVVKTLHGASIYTADDTALGKSLAALQQDIFFKNKDRQANGYYWRVLNLFVEFRYVSKGKTKQTNLVIVPKSEPEQRKEERTEKVDSINRILEKYFENGLLPNAIGLDRFRDLYAEEFPNQLPQEDAALTVLLKHRGNYIDGRIYAKQSDDQSGLLSEIWDVIQETFDQGASCIYLKQILKRWQTELNTKFNIYNETALRDALMTTPRRGIYADSAALKCRNVSMNPAQDVLNALKNSQTEQNYDQLQTELWYLPIERIKFALVQTPGLVNVASETYMYARNFPATPEELQHLAYYMQQEIDRKGYLVSQDISAIIREKCPAIAMNTPGYRDWAYRNVLAYLLKDKFYFGGSVVSAKGTRLEMSDVYRMFCREHETVQVAELKDLSNELGVQIYWEDVLQEMVRVDQNLLVRKDKIHFDVENTDAVLSEMCNGDYIPIQEIELFLQFPATEYPWSRMLLESYVRLYSEEFCLLQISVSESDAYGFIVKKDSNIGTYEDAVIDFLAHRNDYAGMDQALQIIVDNGLQARKKYSNFEIVLQKARLKREQLEKEKR